MTDSELQQARAQKWHLAGRSVRTLDDARTFVESVGFCLLYPLRPPVLAPTFVGAWVGADERLPTWQHAFADPRAQDAKELMVRLPATPSKLSVGMARSQSRNSAPLSAVACLMLPWTAPSPSFGQNCASRGSTTSPAKALPGMSSTAGRPMQFARESVSQWARR